MIYLTEWLGGITEVASDGSIMTSPVPSPRFRSGAVFKLPVCLVVHRARAQVSETPEIVAKVWPFSMSRKMGIMGLVVAGDVGQNAQCHSVRLNQTSAATR